MKSITVFTSNQPRHLGLVIELSKIYDKVYAIIECNTVKPGEVKDFFDKSEIMKTYFSNVMKAEREIFGEISFIPQNVSSLILKMGDLNKIDVDILGPALNSESFVVFGSSYIKGELIDMLIEKKCLNIHMGVSPFYRGSSCNFWALYNENFQYVGATVHLLSKGLDSGDMLFHCLPSFEPDPFNYTMKSVKSAHIGLINRLKDKTIFKLNPLKQNKKFEISYTKNSHFNDEVASRFLDKKIDLVNFENKVKNRNLSEFLNPFVY
tara:strand:- start:91 stop:885 length:795 start_codon:yes stop_codon:yes gene_type:complete